MLPALLAGVDSKTWRSKQGSVQMLGAMAYLAPQPLSTALPKVVPKLSQTLSDPHPKVQAAARQALREVRDSTLSTCIAISRLPFLYPECISAPIWFCLRTSVTIDYLLVSIGGRGFEVFVSLQVGGVIRNPEIQKLVPVLFSAIADPDKNGKKALDMLLSTTFVNTVDAASLALIIPVVQKSLRDRSGEAKKRASRIVGSMCALTNDPKVIINICIMLGRHSETLHASPCRSHHDCLSPPA